MKTQNLLTLIFSLCIHHSIFYSSTPSSTVIFRTQKYSGEKILVMMKADKFKTQPRSEPIYTPTKNSPTLYYRLTEQLPQSSSQWQTTDKLDYYWKMYTNGHSYDSCEDVIRRSPHTETKYYV